MKKTLVVLPLLACLAAFAQQPVKSIKLPSKLIAQVNAGAPGTVSLSCTDALAGVSFNFYRSTASGGEVPPALNSSPVSTCSFTDSPAAGQKFFYVARATIGGVESINSNEVTATTPPPPPQNLTATQN